MGINPGTTEYIIGKSDGVFSCATIRRLPDENAFDPTIIEDIKVRYQDYVMEGASSTPTTIRPAPMSTPMPDPDAAPRVPRRARLRPEDFVKFGYTVGCPGCEQLQLKSSERRNHTEECRRRFAQLLGEAEPVGVPKVEEVLLPDV